MTDLEQLGQAIKRAQWLHHRALDTRLARIGTSLAQWDALRAIARRPGASGHDLAVATFQSDQSFGTLAGRLVAQGLVNRSAGRGRRVDHHLTPAGRRVLEQGQEIATEVLATSLGTLSEQERETLLGLLDRVGRSLTW